MSNIERLRDEEIDLIDDQHLPYPKPSKSVIRPFARAIESAVHAKLSAPVEVGEAPVAEDAAYEMLMALVDVDTHDMNLRDHPDAWAAVERYSASLVEQQAREIAELKAELEAKEARWTRVIKAAEEAHGPAAFRFKMGLRKNGTATNVFPQWLDQRWVSFVYAEDDGHLGLHAKIDQQASRLSRQGEVIKRAVEALAHCTTDEGPDQNDLIRAREVLAELRSVEGV